MKLKRHTAEEIIRNLRDADTGKTIQEVCREHNVSEQSFYRWRKKFGRLEVSDARRMKAMEKENALKGRTFSSQWES